MDYKKRKWIMGILTLMNKWQHTTHGIVHAGFSGIRGFWLVKKVGVN